MLAIKEEGNMTHTAILITLDNVTTPIFVGEEGKLSGQAVSILALHWRISSRAY